jgi:hypothetical protein
VVFRAALGQGALGTGLLMLYGAAEGAAWGAITGGSRADGAWIGAAGGAGLGLVVGLVNGVETARAARSRYLEACQRCLPESQTPSHSAEACAGASARECDRRACTPKAAAPSMGGVAV